MSYKEIEGDLIALAKQGEFDVIAHGCNCFCRQKKGLAPQMVEAFQTDNFPMESYMREGDIDKLGRIDYRTVWIDKTVVNWNGVGNPLIIVNAYTQYKIKKFNNFPYEYTTTENPFDYEAFTLCMRKINHVFEGKHIGLPQIGSHLAGGSWNLIKPIIQKELKDCDVTVVIYKP